MEMPDGNRKEQSGNKEEKEHWAHPMPVIKDIYVRRHPGFVANNPKLCRGRFVRTGRPTVLVKKA
jgi:hypothetical protein